MASPDVAKIDDYAARSAPALLPPLDNLLWNRDRLMRLWSLHYRWEIYTPPSKRKVGPYGMVLVGDGVMMGQVDAWVDRKASALRFGKAELVDGVSRDAFRAYLDRAAQSLMGALGLPRAEMAS